MYIYIYIVNLSELLCLIPILVGSSVATVCPPERDTALRTAVTHIYTPHHEGNPTHPLNASNPTTPAPQSTNPNVKGSPQKGKDQALVSSPVENQYHIIVLLPVPYGQGNA